MCSMVLHGAHHPLLPPQPQGLCWLLSVPHSGVFGLVDWLAGFTSTQLFFGISVSTKNWKSQDKDRYIFQKESKFT